MPCVMEYFRMAPDFSTTLREADLHPRILYPAKLLSMSFLAATLKTGSKASSSKFGGKVICHVEFMPAKQQFSKDCEDILKIRFLPNLPTTLPVSGC